MRRIGWNTLALLSILLLLICLWSWARSYFPHNSRFDTADGRLLIVFWEGRYMPNYNMIDPADDKTYPGGGALWSRLQDFRANGIEEHDFLGFGTISGPIVNMRYHILAIPFWFLALIAAALTATAVFLRRRQRFRVQSGHCLKCGYDLRESKNNCPECGAVIPAT